MILTRLSNLLTLLLLLASGGCDFSADSADSPSTPPTTIRQSSISPGEGEEWVPVSSQAGGFSIQFPTIPIEKNSITPGGIQRHQLQAVMHDGKLVYSSQYADGPPVADVEEQLNHAQNGMLQSLSGSIVEEHAARLGGWPGRAFSFKYRVSGSPGIQHVRIYLVENRAYLLVVAGHPDFVSREDADRFFGSFSLRREDASGQN